MCYALKNDRSYFFRISFWFSAVCINPQCFIMVTTYKVITKKKITSTRVDKAELSLYKIQNYLRKRRVHQQPVQCNGNVISSKDITFYDNSTQYFHIHDLCTFVSPDNFTSLCSKLNWSHYITQNCFKAAT